jgi:hypothetical protein
MHYDGATRTANALVGLLVLSSGLLDGFAALIAPLLFVGVSSDHLTAQSASAVGL